ncbi:sugar kinase [Desemzia sp. RIT804]|uniref:sugar kinase n=1 Tax=Desemzia sp. RIT 804 TaxID=2810209 RepID=UPI00194EB191|nr:sugar kinase [Desemzia sp. RIT 804]MBM6615173.1 sugar kinase [Desemzia sp. RIT 804]
MKDVLLVGEPMGMFIAEECTDLMNVNKFSKGIAGAEVNVGIGLARLGYSVSYATKIGKDPFGTYIAKYLEDENIGTEFVKFDSFYNTGLQMKSKVEKGDPEVAYYRRGSAFSTLSIKDVENIDFNDFRLLHVTGIPPALSLSAREAIFYLMKKAKENNCTITFDPNLRLSLWEDKATMVKVLNELASYADIVLPGIKEGKTLTGQESVADISEFYHKLGVDTVIIKNGSQGAYISKKDTVIDNISGYKVEKVIDTVGAGDGFAVGVISGCLDEVSLEEATKRANAIGSIQVQNIGDNEGLPTKKELKEYMGVKELEKI